MRASGRERVALPDGPRTRDAGISRISVGAHTIALAQVLALFGIVWVFDAALSSPKPAVGETFETSRHRAQGLPQALLHRRHHPLRLAPRLDLGLRLRAVQAARSKHAWASVRARRLQRTRPASRSARPDAARLERQPSSRPCLCDTPNGDARKRQKAGELARWRQAMAVQVLQTITHSHSTAAAPQLAMLRLCFAAPQQHRRRRADYRYAVVGMRASLL